MNAIQLINKLPAAFNQNVASGMDCTIQFNISDPQYVVIKDGACSAHKGTAAQSSLDLTIDAADLVDLMTGRLDAMQAFMTGKLQVSGDLALAQKIGRLFDPAKLA